MEIPAGKELDTAIALAFPELKARFVKGARCGETTVREGPSMSLEMCRTACERAELWAGVPFEPITTTPFSTNIHEAWNIVEKLKADGWHGTVCTHNNGIDHTPEELPLAAFEQDYGRVYVEAVAPTAPEAICRAALKAYAAVSKP